MRKFIRDWDRKNLHLNRGSYRGALAEALVELERYELKCEPDKEPSFVGRFFFGAGDGYSQAQKDKLDALEAEVVRCEQEWKVYNVSLQEERDNKAPF